MRFAAVAVALLAIACSDEALAPRGQVLLYLDTDAPVPPSPGTFRQPDDPVPLFDRVRIDVYRPGESEPCDGCSREFELDHGLLLAARASVGIVPVPGQRLTVRARMYRAASSTPEGPKRPATVDHFVLLPPVDSEGLKEVTILLLTDDVGKRIGSLEAPTEPENGRPSPSRVGSWPYAARVPCSGPAQAHEACVPGGAFWMGNPSIRGFLDGTDADRERIVVLSPFFIDRAEVTVARWRASGIVPEGVWSGDENGDDSHDWCTYTKAEGPRDDLPMSCIAWNKARQFCKSLGADLPTEAQYEYVAGSLESRRFPWGSDEPECSDAAWGRAGFGVFGEYPDRCREPGSIGLPDPAGSGDRDRVLLGGAEVVDLAGNLQEWMLDHWSRQDEACWAGPGVFHDPVCDTFSDVDPPLRSARGGAWQFDGTFLSAAVRGREHPEQGFPALGVRCTRPAGG